MKYEIRISKQFQNSNVQNIFLFWILKISICLGFRYSSFGFVFIEKHGGAFTGRATPVPIPNTAVKPSWADGTAAARLWESRSAPPLFLFPFIALSINPSLNADFS